MNKKTYGVLAVTFLLGMASCSDDNPWLDLPDGQGAISLSLAADGSVRKSAPTRAEGSYSLPVPDLSDFNIHLVKSDGSHDRHYSHDEFLKMHSFNTGSYSLTAYAGDPEKEGFDAPYFEGSADVLVLEGKDSPVQVTASVQRALVSVEYSEDFSKYMSAFSASVHSAGHDYIDIAYGENRPVYLIPGKTTLGVSLTNKQGQSVTVEPSEFTTEAGHHYTIRLNIGESSRPGIAALSIDFSDELVEEEVIIDLTDELFSAPAPEVRLTGVDEVQEGEVPTLEFLAGEAPDGNYRFTVLSYGGLKEVRMTLNGSTEEFFAGDIQLMNADQSVQDRLASYGIVCKGLYNNPEKMAYIDFSGLPARLPAGNYTLMVEAKDMLNRVSELAKVNINSVRAELSVVGVKALFGPNVGTLLIDYNGSHPMTDITFKADDKYGNMVDAPIIDEPTESLSTRSFETKKYVYNIKLPDFGGREKERVDVYLYGEFQQTVWLDVEVPEYKVETDAFAKKVMLKVTATEIDMTPAIVGALKLYDENGAAILASRVSRDSETGIITVSGLESDNDYNFRASLLGIDSQDVKQLGFKTESEDQIPNGDLSSTHPAINIKSINTGGEYKTSLHSRCYNFTDIIRDEADGWATLNQLTCYEGSNPKNTWFMVPSTFVENGIATIRSVAYDHNGEEPEYINNGTSDRWYSGNTPKKLSGRSTGEMFLGTYSYDGNAHRTDGIRFAVRPTSVEFEYTYAPCGDEVGEIMINVIGKNNSVLATAKADITKSDVSSKMTVALPDYTIFGEKAARLQISFKSTKGENINVVIPSGADLYDREHADNSIGGWGITPPASSGFHIKPNMYYAVATGSVLTVANVKLGYDDNKAAAGMKKRNKGNKKR